MDKDTVAETRASQDGASKETLEGQESKSSAAGEEENNFQKAIAAWRNIDLTTLVPVLDTAASDLVTNQRDTLTQRKDLAQKTKDFRKLDDAGKLSEIKGLLKAYQTFIDLISNQSKSVSAAFFQVYTPLSEAPDPYPLLEASVDSLVTSIDTVPRLEKENGELRSNVARLSSQLEENENKLQEERTARQSLEEGQDAKIEEVESSWSAVLSEKQDNWEAKEKSLEEKVENQDRLLKEIKASYEVSQRLDRGEESENDGHRGATAAELEIVSSELERATMRLADVEARNEQLRLELAQSTSQRTQHVSFEDEPAFQRLQAENSSLLRKIDTARLEKDSERRRIEGETRSLEREITTLKKDRDALKDKVQKWGDYENVKQELEVLKSIEFATGDDDDGDDIDETQLVDQNGSAQKGKGDTLEQLLLSRNKKLSNELTVLRVSHQDLQTRLETLQEDLSSTNMALEKSRALTATLETDLEKVQQEASNAFDSSAMSVAGTYTSRYPSTSYPSRRGRSSPTSSIISGFDPAGSTSSPKTTLDAIRAGEPVGGGSGILPMITAQRDRFKAKNSALETELAAAHTTVSSLRSEVASLQKDNLNLYEKTRYVSTYNRGGATSASSYANNPNPSTIQMSADSASGLTTDRYRSAYESSLSPFAAFRGRESARALKRMTLPERVVFRITRLVLATRASRNLFAFYCLALHVLVFVMLYWMSTVEIEMHTSHLSGAAVQAVVDGPLGAGGGGGKEWRQEGFEEGG